jgi:hypothetical protein
LETFVFTELESLGDPVRDEALIQKLEAEVNKAIPIDLLWVPGKSEPSIRSDLPLVAPDRRRIVGSL